MATKITRDTIESYLNCKYKGYLKLTGECGSKSDYETMTNAARGSSREQALARLAARSSEGDVCQGTTFNAATLMQGPLLLVDATLEDDALSLRLDALKRLDGTSKLGGHHYVPILHNPGDKVGRQDRLKLAVFALLLGRVQGVRLATGLVTRGPEGRLGKVRLDAKVYRQSEQVLDEVKRLQSGGELPRLRLNGHCQQCEFRQRCRRQAEEADDISLLGGMGDKQLQRFYRKGIFTLTQLSCTFRPRKRGKRVKRKNHPRYAALQALAIREKKVHVYGTPDLLAKPVEVFFDAEGNEDGSFVYLLGVIMVDGDSQKAYSFWADSPAEEVQVFDAFLDLLEDHEDFALFHYGTYEKAVLQRMRKVVARKDLVDRALGNAVNVLSVIHAGVYFPTFSNGLKEVAGYLGCTWTDESASGLQSLVWRSRWEQAKEPDWKDKLVAYNAEDCAALREVTAFVQAIGEAARRRGDTEGATAGPQVAWADDIRQSPNRREFCQAKFALQDFDYVNQCAYFDYQREKVFLRTSRVVKRACALHRKKWIALQPTREVESSDDACPYCGGVRLTRLPQRTHAKVAYDLEFTRGGIRRRVIRCRAFWHWCEGCQAKFLPEGHTRRDKHLHGLKSWAMYQHVVHRVNFAHLHSMLLPVRH